MATPPKTARRPTSRSAAFVSQDKIVGEELNAGGELSR
jgi:hypothetical protein